ncbi:hypothetical protein [Herbidospora mongoliensis]|uniref:hypothetical protein n=1 Tax=Herbidospora mongoliensis TaxID=688067 RepID=UPI00082C0B49|nr:hypothetical protein [Herbidospora mongoliensis]
MGIGRRASNLGAGVLAVAIGATFPLLAAEAARAADCAGGGLLPGVTDTLCKVVDGVTDLVDDVTGDGLDDVTDTVDKVVGGVTGSDSTKTSTPSPTPAAPQKEPTTGPSVSGADDGTSGGTSVSACTTRCAHSPAPTLDAEPVRVKPATPSPAAERKRRRERRPEPRPQFIDDGRPIVVVAAEPTPRPTEPAEIEPVRVDEVAPPLLWPGQLIPELMSDDIPKTQVRPKQTYDPVATGLTTLLLVSAVLAARVAWIKRARKEELEALCPEALPLSGLPSASRRRQRIA